MLNTINFNNKKRPHHRPRQGKNSQRTDFLARSDIFKSTQLDEIEPRVLRELAEVISEALAIIFENLCPQQNRAIAFLLAGLNV